MRSDLWAIIPVKPFGSGKSRLAQVLGAQERETLNRQLFERVFEAAIAVLGPQRVAVVTADPGVWAHVTDRGAHAVVERSADDLNAALGQGCRYALDHGARANLVLPSDLPFLATDDIDALIAALVPAPSCVIAPDALDRATNALVIAPPDPDFFRFGPDSFSAHVQAAAARGAAVAIVRRPGLAFDLDTPEDYQAYSSRRATPAAAGAPS